jgi:hypothetical protein
MRQPWCRIVRSLFVGMALFISLYPTLADACAVCAGSEDHGYFWGVLFLMAMPFVIGSSIGGWLLYSYRGARHQAAQAHHT